MTKRGAYKKLLHDHVGATEARAQSDYHRELREALEYLAGVIAGPVVVPYPSLADEWHSMDCRKTQSKSCRCGFCEADKINAPRVDEWRRAMHLRPQPQHPFPCGSLADAVTRLCIWKQDGAHCESWAGPMLSKARDEATSGVKSHAAPRSDRDPRQVYIAGRSVDTEKALVHVYQDDKRRRGLRTHACIGLLAASIVDDKWDAGMYAERVGVPTADVIGIVKAGRRHGTVELAARGIVPAPTKPRLMVVLVAERQAELARNAH